MIKVSKKQLVKLIREAMEPRNKAVLLSNLKGVAQDLLWIKSQNGAIATTIQKTAGGNPKLQEALEHLTLGTKLLNDVILEMEREGLS